MRLIDADVLLSKPWGVAYHPYEADGSISECDAVAEAIIKECRNIVHDAPTVEPKKGEWVESDVSYFVSLSNKVFYCSVCDAQANDKSNFCPNCGADMRGENDEIN